MAELDTTTKAESNKVLDPIISDISSRQSAYLSQKGRYWQGIQTNSPSTRSVIVHKERKPTDQDEDWTSFGAALPDSSKYSFRVDVYESPDGHGFTVTSQIKANEGTFTRTRNFGPETYREHDWITL